MQGGHPPADEHGLAWSPREWHLTPDTMALARFDAPAEPSNGGDATQQPAHAKSGVGRPPKTSRQAGPGSGSGAAGARGGSGAPREVKRRAPRPKITRTCSAEGCSNAVPDRTQGAVLMCSLHRRATTGVLVRDCPELMRWCHHCKKPHCLSAFADSRIGMFRKLATCERGRQVRRVNTAIKRAAEGNPPAKGNRRSASPDDPATTTTTATTATGLFPRSQPSSPHPPPASDLQPGAWQLPEFTPVAFEISAPVHPIAVSDTGQRPFDFVAQLVSEALGGGAEGEGAGVHDDNMSGSSSSSGSHETLPGEGEGEGEGDATLGPDLFSDPNLILPSLGPVEEMLDAARPLDVAPSSFIDFILDSAEAAILPGSVRLHVRSCVPTPHGKTSAHLELGALCEAVPCEGMFGARAVTVSVMSDALLGHGWKTPLAGGAAGSSASASASGSGSRSFSGRVVTFDAETRVSSVPLPMTPFPEWVRVPPVAVLGRPFHVRGLRGGETVHVFGQSMRPYSVVIPNGVGGGSLRVATLALADELGGIPGDHPVVPGFLQVQVLRPGQPAAGAECVNILLAEDDATALELDALRRGAGDGARSILDVDDACRELIEDAGLDAPLAPIAGFVSESAFERFAGDFARMVELHWRSRLYHPSARDAARRVMSLAARVFDRERAPAILGALEDIVNDVDAQEEAEAEAEETRGGGFFRLLRRIGVPVGEDKLGGHHDKCTGSRGSEAVPRSARRFDAMGAWGFRRFFAPLPGDETAVESKESTKMDDGVCPIPTSTYIDAHARLSTVYLAVVIVAVLRAHAWGVKPSDIALVEVPVLALYCAPFAVGSRLGMTRAAIARLRERVVGVGLDGAYEALVVTAIQLSNGIGRALIFCGTNPPTGSAPDSRWIILTACATVNLTVYALFSAEAAPPSRKRADVLVMGAVSFAAMMFPCPIIAPEAAARQGMFAPFGSVWSAAAWLFLLPSACATAARRAYRAAIRSRGHPRAFESRLETAEAEEEMTKTSGSSFGLRAGFRRLFVLPLDDHVFTVATPTYIDEHRCSSRLLVTLVILGVLRAPAWGIKPSDMAISYTFVLALYWAPFEVGSRFEAARAAIARLRERVVGAGLDGAYEALVYVVLQLSNGIGRALIFCGTNPIVSAPDSRWIILAACATVNLTIYAIFTAEIALPSRKRVDVLVLGAVSFTALTFPCLVIAPEEAARQGMFAPHGSVWSAAAWLFLLPVACATAARRAYRAAIRSRGHPRAFESRLETAEAEEDPTNMDDDVYTVPTSTYIDAHARLSTVYFVLVIVAVLRAHAWGVKPSDMALVEVPLLALYCAPFAVGSRLGMTRAAIARLRERVVGVGLDGAYEALVVALLSLANGMDYGLMLLGTNPPTVSAPDSRWIIITACATVNLTVYALFSAEAAPPSRKRADVLVMGAVSFVTMMVGCHIVCPEAMRMHQKGMFAPFGSVWSAAAWLFLLPAACATAARRAYRASVRSVTRRKLE